MSSALSPATGPDGSDTSIQFPPHHSTSIYFNDHYQLGPHSESDLKSLNGSPLPSPIEQPQQAGQATPIPPPQSPPPTTRVNHAALNNQAAGQQEDGSTPKKRRPSGTRFTTSRIKYTPQVGPVDGGAKSAAGGSQPGVAAAGGSAGNASNGAVDRREATPHERTVPSTRKRSNSRRIDTPRTRRTATQPSILAHQRSHSQGIASPTSPSQAQNDRPPTPEIKRRASEGRPRPPSGTYSQSEDGTHTESRVEGEDGKEDDETSMERCFMDAPGYVYEYCIDDLVTHAEDMERQQLQNAQNGKFAC